MILLFFTISTSFAFQVLEKLQSNTKYKQTKIISSLQQSVAKRQFDKIKTKITGILPRIKHTITVMTLIVFFYSKKIVLYNKNISGIACCAAKF
jgi:hypothetical protein